MFLFSRLAGLLGRRKMPRTPEEAEALKQRIRTTLTEAETAFKEGKPAEAERLYREVSRLDPKNVTAYANLGAVYSAMEGRSGDAVVVMEAARNLDPENMTVRLNLATLYIQQANFKRAFGVLEEVRAARPRLPGLHYTFGCAYFYQGDRENALAEFEREVEVNPGHEHAGRMVEEMRKQESGGG